MGEKILGLLAVFNGADNRARTCMLARGNLRLMSS